MKAITGQSHAMALTPSSVDPPPLTGDLWANLLTGSHPTATTLAPAQGNPPVIGDCQRHDTVFYPAVPTSRLQRTILNPFQYHSVII